MALCVNALHWLSIPLGTLKQTACWDHFDAQTRKPQGEFSLRVLEHNFMCVLNILDMDTLRDYCVQRSENKTVNLGYA